MKVKQNVPQIKSNYTKELLKFRGVENVDNFLNPNESDLESPFLLQNIKKGVEVIRKFYKKGAKIGTIVDCDMDGMTSASILYLYMKELDPSVTIKYYLHDGKEHGFSDVCAQMEEENYDYLLIADAATNDSNYIRNFECPVIIIDHHELEDNNGLAQNLILINNQTSPEYKNKQLSGAGLAYQFCRALDKEFGVNYADNYVDLAAMGCIGDMMSALEIENQFLWRKGLTSIKNSFLRAIIDKQSFSMKGEVTPMTVAFYIVPLVNAMIRVGTKDEKERMFLAFLNGDELIPSGKRGAKGTLDTRANESARECTNARARQNKLLDQITDSLEIKIHKYDLLENKILFIRLDDDDEFPATLNGLCAMKLSAKYRKPTIIARLNPEGYDRGSLRGVNGSELLSFKDYLESTGLFEYTVGHANAGGISILNSNLKELHTRANEELAAYDFGENFYEVDFTRRAAEEDIKDIIYDIGLYHEIYGQRNPEPLIYVTDININKKDIKIIGKNLDVLKFEKNGIEYIKFFAKDLIKKLDKYNGELKIEVIGKMGVNEFMGNCTPQITIEEIELKDGALAF